MSLSQYMPHSTVANPSLMPHHFLTKSAVSDSVAPAGLATYMPHSPVAANPDALMPHHFLAKREPVPEPSASLPAPSKAAAANPISLGQPTTEEATYISVLKLKTRLFFKLTLSRFGCT